jgi:general secretion pathway protein D
MMITVQAQDEQLLSGNDAIVPVAADKLQEVAQPVDVAPTQVVPTMAEPQVVETPVVVPEMPKQEESIPAPVQPEVAPSATPVPETAKPEEPIMPMAQDIAAPAAVVAQEAPAEVVSPVVTQAPKVEEIPQENVTPEMPIEKQEPQQPAVVQPEEPQGFSSTRMLRGGDMVEKPIAIIPPMADRQQVKPLIMEAAPVEEAKTEQEKSSADYAYLGKFLKPWELITRDKLIEINFENAQLMNLIQYFEKEYGLTFILDNVIEPMAEGGKNPVGIRFSFKTERPLNKKQAWDLFVAFLDMAGLMLIPGPTERIYQITNNKADSRFSASKEPIPTFVGIDQALLPTSDIKIRYVYFIQNTTVDTVKSVVEKLRSPISSPPILVGELNALILTDRASNIQTILTILKELDKPVLPETLTVLQLKKTEAEKVKTLYDNLVNEEKNLFPRLAPWARKQSVGYFTENVRLVADKRTNSLIILGPRQNVKKIEDFITKEIDREIDLPYSPLHVYPLKFIDAAATAQIINDLKAGFQSATTAGQTGGLIGGTRFIKPTVTITAEKLNNSLIINADYDDYLQIYELLEKIDIEQPQVAIRILVLDVTLSDDRKLGMQLRTPVPFLGNGSNVNFQNSGLPITDTSSSGLIQNFNSTTQQASLLGDLINLVVGQETGSTILTLPSDSFGIYGILKALQRITNVSVIAKPFLVTSHKYNASINIAETRRVTTANIVGGSGTKDQQSQGDLSAGLSINLSPQISPDNYVTLDVTVTDSQFTQGSSTSPTDIATGNRNEKSVKSSVILGDNQVLALGGIIIDRELENIYKVPLLGDIPLLGWFFKSKTKIIVKTSLLILISAQIIRPQAQDLIDGFTRQRLEAARGVLARMDNDDQGRDPVHRWFFEDHDDRYQNNMNKILSISDTKLSPKQTLPEPALPEAEKKTGRITHADRVNAQKGNVQVQPKVETSALEPKKTMQDPVPVTPEQPKNDVPIVKMPAVQEPVAQPEPIEAVESQSAAETVADEPQSSQKDVVPEVTADQSVKTDQPVKNTNNRRRLRAFVPVTKGADAS